MTADANVPRGTVTFLFTDIEGSTALWESDRAATQAAVVRHYAILGEAVVANHGRLFKHVGDAAQAAFSTAGDALAAAVAAQRTLIAEPWPVPGPLRVRMALHTGEAAPDHSGDYNQIPALNRLSRLLAVAHGGQILLTQTTRGLIDHHLPAEIALHDLGEQRLRDLQQPERVWQVLAPGLPATFPAIRGAKGHPTNLQPPPTPLIGREDDVARIRTLIEREKAQLVTLTGPGGTGKTRLALAVAAELRDDFPDGVWFVDLAPLSDSALVETTIAATLGVRETSARPLRDALVDFLAGRRVLLVIDNVEHLLPAAALVDELARAGPGSAILATSREPLRLRGEREIAVAPLALPENESEDGGRRTEVRDGKTKRQAIEQAPAVQLFVERAQATKPDFALNDANAAAIAAICRRLDGLPLAIELAAARVKLLPPQALLARLERSLPLLTSGPRDAPTRQRTLRDAIAWSHDLLTSDEQMIFRRLGVVAGGFSLETAVAVAGSGQFFDILEGLTSLADKSLVRQFEHDDGESRFSLLETIREFAVEQLRESGEEDRIRSTHASWFLSAATDWRDLIWGPQQRAVQQCVALEAGNFRAALEWLLDRGDVEQAAALVVALVDFWYIRSQLREATEWLERINARAQELSVRQAAAIVSRLATFLHPQEDDERAEELAERAVQMHRELRGTPDFDGRELAFALFVWGQSLSNPIRQLGALNEALEHFRALGDKAWMGHTLSNLAITSMGAGGPEPAIPFAEAAVTLQHEAQNRWGLSLAKDILAELLRLNGNTSEAMRLSREALERVRQTEDLWRIANSLRCIAAILVESEHTQIAARLLGTANHLRARYGAIRESEVWDFEPELAKQIRDAIGEQVFVEEFTAGMDTPLDEIVAIALSLPVEPRVGATPASPALATSA